MDNMTLQQYVNLYKQPLTEDNVLAIEKLTEVATKKKKEKKTKKKKLAEEGLASIGLLLLSLLLLCCCILSSILGLASPILV